MLKKTTQDSIKTSANDPSPTSCRTITVKLDMLSGTAETRPTAALHPATALLHVSSGPTVPPRTLHHRGHMRREGRRVSYSAPPCSTRLGKLTGFKTVVLALKFERKSRDAASSFRLCEVLDESLRVRLGAVEEAGWFDDGIKGAV